MYPFSHVFNVYSQMSTFRHMSIPKCPLSFMCIFPNVCPLSVTCLQYFGGPLAIPILEVLASENNQISQLINGSRIYHTARTVVHIAYALYVLFFAKCKAAKRYYTNKFLL